LAANLTDILSLMVQHKVKVDRLLNIPRGLGVALETFL